MKTSLRNNKRKFWTLIISLGLVAALAIGITIAWFSDTQTLTNTATVASVDITLVENVANASILDPDETTLMPNSKFVPDMNDPFNGITPTNPQFTVTDPSGSGVPSPLLPGSYTPGVGATYPVGLPGASYIKAPTVTNVEEPVFLRLVVSRTWGPMTPAGNIDYIILHLVNTTGLTGWTHDIRNVSGKEVSGADNGDGILDDVFYYNSILETNTPTTMPFDYFTISSLVNNDYVNVPANVSVKAEALQASGLRGTYATANLIPETLWDSVESVTP